MPLLNYYFLADDLGWGHQDAIPVSTTAFSRALSTAAAVYARAAAVEQCHAATTPQSSIFAKLLFSPETRPGSCSRDFRH